MRLNWRSPLWKANTELLYGILGYNPPTSHNALTFYLVIVFTYFFMYELLTVTYIWFYLFFPLPFPMKLFIGFPYHLVFSIGKTWRPMIPCIWDSFDVHCCLLFVILKTSIKTVFKENVTWPVSVEQQLMVAHRRLWEKEDHTWCVFCRRFIRGCQQTGKCLM